MADQDQFIEIIRNKKARFNYEILEVFEAGIVLHGTEVKSLRLRNCSIQESYAHIRNGEVFLVGMSISPYEMGNRFNVETVRDRKLLMHKHQIKWLTGKLKEKGYTLVPLRLYFKNGKAKIELGLGRGKAAYDKRKTIQKRDLDRDMQRDIKKYT
jgi:SsrA-binding protein